jgi:hypothetical protein
LFVCLFEQCHGLLHIPGVCRLQQTCDVRE